MQKESKFQSNLKKEIKATYPHSICHKTDCGDIQGIPDLMVSNKGKVAYLECKRSADAPHRPNQDYYVNYINENDGFARFIYPENKEDVLNEMEEFFNGV